MAEVVTTKNTFAPHETELMLAAIVASQAACKRGMNTAKNPQFKELYEKDLRDLIILESKIRGFK